MENILGRKMEKLRGRNGLRGERGNGSQQGKVAKDLREEKGERGKGEKDLSRERGRKGRRSGANALGGKGEK